MRFGEGFDHEAHRLEVEHIGGPSWARVVDRRATGRSGRDQAFKRPTFAASCSDLEGGGVCVVYTEARTAPLICPKHAKPFLAMRGGF